MLKLLWARSLRNLHRVTPPCYHIPSWDVLTWYWKMFDYAWREEGEVDWESRWVSQVLLYLSPINSYWDGNFTTSYIQGYIRLLCTNLDSKRGERAKVEIHLRRAFFFSMIRTRNTSWRPVLRGPRPWDPRASPGSGPESSAVVVVEKMRGLWNLVSFDVKWLFSIHRMSTSGPSH